MTFKQMREMERIAEASNIGPGAFDGHIKPFGSDVKTKVTFGSKYEFKANANPAPG